MKVLSFPVNSLLALFAEIDRLWQRGILLEGNTMREKQVIFIGPTRLDRAVRYCRLALGAWMHDTAYAILKKA